MQNFPTVPICLKGFSVKKKKKGFSDKLLLFVFRIILDGNHRQGFYSWFFF